MFINRMQRFFVVILSTSLLWLLILTTSAHAQGISTGDGTWVWQNPLPQGNSLYDVWEADADNVWAVGVSGTILKWDGHAWANQSSGTSSSLEGVWGMDVNNVWAV